MSHHAIPCPDRHLLVPTSAASTSLRMFLVTGLTLVTMVIEIGAGWLSGSVALLADGIHMGTHAAAIGGAYLAHTFARRHAADVSFSFGTGKVEALAAFGSTVLLALAALGMVVEAVERLVAPQPIRAGEALVVAVMGLAVNLASAWLLAYGGREHPHNHHGDSHSGGNHHHGHSHDLNLRAAYFHVIADSLTSVLAILALVAAATAGAVWLDPLVAFVGAAVVLRWSYGLARESSAVLLDREAPLSTRHAVERAIEADGTSEVTDLHIWPIAPGRYALVAALVASRPVTPAEIKARLPRDLALFHPVIEVNQQ
ncbi:MAG: CDF family Co(II)/Ni(II) efflux transporter DmeF [Rhizobiales bacterium]|nr:CDF family Co(II)/Ni(II) efflux transporter DmeF [Hyphomicrobiales bacterium]